MIVAVVSLIATSLIGKDRHLIPYFFWLMALGALGSIAYISMNALSLQKSITFDIGNQKLLVIRIMLGAMFGLILALPFGFGGFEHFIQTLDAIKATTSSGATTATDAKMAATLSAEDAMMAVTLLMPFVFGFSTTLVLIIINRLLDAIGVIFGKPPNTQSDNVSH
ncbi:hypothetical protein GCM10007857_56070 [Bradyrhizobium iriomotense]|uniref:Uncharacterized protein n=2 Tax=Bradyrhizobium iriomotense TaxID=441950 RepID=A0ABQ6B617_9BRAD|nr:hypothetical protein GCM10007857_56070 [Bradyrhizobium iriomotense]